MRFQRELASEERQYRDHRHAHRSSCDYIGKIPCDVISNQSLLPYGLLAKKIPFRDGDVQWAAELRSRDTPGFVTSSILRHCFQTPWFFSFLDNMVHLKMYICTLRSFLVSQANSKHVADDRRQNFIFETIRSFSPHCSKFASFLNVIRSLEPLNVLKSLYDFDTFYESCESRVSWKRCNSKY